MKTVDSNASDPIRIALQGGVDPSYAERTGLQERDPAVAAELATRLRARARRGPFLWLFLGQIALFGFLCLGVLRPSPATASLPSWLPVVATSLVGCLALLYGGLRIHERRAAGAAAAALERISAAWRSEAS